MWRKNSEPKFSYWEPKNNYSILSFFQDLKDKMKRVLKEKQKNLKKKSEILAEKVSPREEDYL